MSYGQVQFIAYCIHTGPELVSNNKKKYMGIQGLDQKKDINERVNLVNIAIEKAEQNIKQDENTLKIFMLPEFFFRGAEGAYSVDGYYYLMNELQKLVKAPKWKNWIFVFGTIVAQSSSYHKSDEKSDEKDDKLDKVEVYNISLVQNGGFNNEKDAPYYARIIMKEHFSEIDFIKREKMATNANGEPSGFVWERVLNLPTVNQKKRDKQEGYYREQFKNLTEDDLKIFNEEEKKHYKDYQTNSTYMSPRFENLFQKYLKSKIPEEQREEFSQFNFAAGTSIFRMEGIMFGLEVCLDHKTQRLKKSIEYQKSGGNGIVDIQLIPSCGTYIHEDAIVVREGGYIFNCDGLDNYKDFENGGFLSHSALGTTKNSKFKSLREEITNTQISIDRGHRGIYPLDNGDLHIYKPQALSQQALGYSLSQSHFPRSESSFTTALSSEPVLLNGMQVIFDQPTPVYPVTLEPKD